MQIPLWACQKRTVWSYPAVARMTGSLPTVPWFTFMLDRRLSVLGERHAGHCGETRQHSQLPQLHMGRWFHLLSYCGHERPYNAKANVSTSLALFKTIVFSRASEADTLRLQPHLTVGHYSRQVRLRNRTNVRSFSLPSLAGVDDKSVRPRNVSLSNMRLFRQFRFVNRRFAAIY